MLLRMQEYTVHHLCNKKRENIDNRAGFLEQVSINLLLHHHHISPAQHKTNKNNNS